MSSSLEPDKQMSTGNATRFPLILHECSRASRNSRTPEHAPEHARAEARIRVVSGGYGV